MLDNYGAVRYQLDTSKLLPAVAQSQTYRVWVVLDPQDPGNQAGQTHGWRQPNITHPKNRCRPARRWS